MPEPLYRTRDALARQGWSAARVNNAIRRGRCDPVTRGVLLPATVSADLWQRCAAALATQRSDSAVSRRTAALVRGFDWLPAAWARAQAPIAVTVARDDTTRSTRAGVDRRIAALPCEDVDTRHGLRVTTDARTAVDLARSEHRVVALQVMDWLLTSERTTREEMTAVVDRMVRVPGVSRARKLIDLAEVGVGSPRETATRLLMIDAGLPRPSVNLKLWDGDLLVAQGDLGYWQWLIWIEYDGRDEHSQRRAMGADQAKDRWLVRRGWEIFRVSARDHQQPSTFLGEVAEAVRDAPRRVAALDPRRSPEVARAHRLLGI